MNWIMKDGQKINIKDMTTPHILNCMDMIYKYEPIARQYKLQQAKVDAFIHLEGNALVAAQYDIEELEEKANIYADAYKSFEIELKNRVEFKKVLCMTKDKAMRDIIQILGKKNKWDVFATGNYSQGHFWAIEQEWDAIIIDLKYPKGIVKDVIETQVKKNILIYADYTEVEKAVRKVEEGAADLIHKPFDVSLLKLRIEQVSS